MSPDRGWKWVFQEEKRIFLHTFVQMYLQTQTLAYTCVCPHRDERVCAHVHTLTLQLLKCKVLGNFL